MKKIEEKRKGKKRKPKGNGENPHSLGEESVATPKKQNWNHLWGEHSKLERVHDKKQQSC